jgi:signal peptidase
MKPTDLVRYVFVGTIVVLILALLVTQLIGQPFIIFVETGSMEPTLKPNDGFLAVPAFLAGEPQEGDVILFESQEIGGGELTTHRVVRETDRGYITKGDANPFTDQDGDEPPVSEGQIKSVGLQFGGELVVIPGFGASITSVTSVVDTFQVWLFGLLGMEPPGVTTFSTAILVMGLVLFVFSAATSDGGDTRSRSTGSIFRNAVVVIAILTLVVIIPVNFSMLLPSGVYQIEIVSSVDPAPDQRIIQAGGSSEVTYFMQNSGHLPVLVFLQPASDGVDTPDRYTYVPRKTRVNQTVTMQAPNETGTYLRFVREYRYLVLLPPSLIATLHNIHPVLALAAINVTVAAVVVLISLGTIGTGRVRVRSRSREITIEDQIRRRLPPLSMDGRDTPSRPTSRRDTMYNWFNRRERTDSNSGPVPGRDGGRGRSGGPSPPGPPPGPPSGAGPGGDTGLAPGRATDPGADPAADPDGDAGPEPESGTESGSDSGFGAGMGEEPDADELDGRQLIELYDTLQNPPDAVGIEATRWTPELLQDHLRESYDVQYSPEECAQLLERAGADTDAGGPDT